MYSKYNKIIFTIYKYSDVADIANFILMLHFQTDLFH